MGYDIFISYRRKGGLETAKHIYDLLLHDGYSVSFDIDTLRNGLWTTELEARIAECKDFIIILNKGVFDRTLDESVPFEDDWLRRELARAISLKKNIIPVMLSDFDGFPKNLPDDVKLISKVNSPKYDGYYFDAFYERLKSKFLISRPSVENTESKSCCLKLRTDSPCSIFVDEVEKCSLEPGKLAKLRLSPGTYMLKFIDRDFPLNFYEVAVEVVDDYEKLLYITLASSRLRVTPPPIRGTNFRSSQVPPKFEKKVKNSNTIKVIFIILGWIVASIIVTAVMIGAIEGLFGGNGTSEEELKLEPYYDSESQLWGYKNQNGDVHFVPQFQNASGFSDGDTLACVTKDGTDYFLGISGNLYEINFE